MERPLVRLRPGRLAGLRRLARHVSDDDLNEYGMLCSRLTLAPRAMLGQWVVQVRRGQAIDRATTGLATSLDLDWAWLQALAMARSDGKCMAPCVAGARCPWTRSMAMTRGRGAEFAQVRLRLVECLFVLASLAEFQRSDPRNLHVGTDPTHSAVA